MLYFNEGFFTENVKNNQTEEIHTLLSKIIMNKIKYVSIIIELDNYLVKNKSEFRIDVKYNIDIKNYKYTIILMTDKYYKKSYSNCIIL